MAPPVPTLPTGPLDLLVRAALAPREIALAAWREWRRSYTLDETPWNEVRLLGAVTWRMDWLEPDADILRRMQGIQKFLFAQTQLCLTRSMPALRCLARAEIPVLLIKGAARVAADARTARARLVRDLDVLVPLDRASEAFSALQAAQWDFKADGKWQVYWHALDGIANHHAWSLSDGTVEFDLHHFSNGINRLAGDDDGLWQRAERRDWRELPVLLPAPTDGLILSIVHGLRWSREHNADWLIDACSCLDTGQVDWQLVVEESGRRGLDAFLSAGLGYMRDVLQRDIPGSVLEALALRATVLHREELDVFASVSLPRTPAQNEVLLKMAVERCGNPPPGPAAAPGRISLAIAAETLPQRMNVDISRFAPEAETGELTFHLDLPSAPSSGVIATLCIMGLVIDCRSGVPRSSARGGQGFTFTFTIPRRMLARRAVSRLCLTIGTGDAPMYPPWRYRLP